MTKLSVKSQLAIVAIVLALGFASGRYSLPRASSDVKTQVEVVKDKDVRTHTETTEVKTPDGTTTVKTVTDRSTSTKTDSIAKKEAVVTQKHTSYNISALTAVKINDLEPVYGISVSKEFVGPLTVGAFGLTNGTLGLSVGVNF